MVGNGATPSVFQLKKEAVSGTFHSEPLNTEADREGAVSEEDDSPWLGHSFLAERGKRQKARHRTRPTTPTDTHSRHAVSALPIPFQGLKISKCFSIISS